jgi:hypothetical protein
MRTLLLLIAAMSSGFTCVARDCKAGGPPLHATPAMWCPPPACCGPCFRPAPCDQSEASCWGRPAIRHRRVCGTYRGYEPCRICEPTASRSFLEGEAGARKSQPGQIRLGPNDVAAKGNDFLLLPLLAAARAEHLQVTRACLEDGKCVVYVMDGDNRFNIDAFVDAGVITISVVAYLPGQTGEETQEQADSLKDRIVSQLPKQMDRLSEKPKEAGK